MCPVGISLELGFGQGPGGSEAAAHAALMGLRFHRRSEPVLFRRCLSDQNGHHGKLGLAEDV